MAENSTLCPQCGAVMEPGEELCRWCGTSRPRGGSRLRGWRAVAGDGARLVQWIVAANVLFYLFSLWVGRGEMLDGSPLTFLSPSQASLLVLGATGYVPVVEFGRFWTLVAASYLHGGLLHIFFNMMALRQIGPWVASEFGASRMFVIYTASGVSGYLASCLAGVPFTIGASAAVCGLIGALFYFGKSRGGSYGSAVSRVVSGWLISLAIFGFVMPGINNWGHGGGIVGGIVFGWLLGYRERRPDRGWHLLLALICLALTIAILATSAYLALTLSPADLKQPATI